MPDPLAPHDVELVRAANPGALTLSGTNTWLAGRDPCWVVDPGPLLHRHVEAVLAAGALRGGLGGVAVTHDHADHSGAAMEIGRRAGAPVAAAALQGADRIIADGDRLGPLEVIALPGHASDHLCFAFGAVCFTGDAVLGDGSVFISPGRGALSGYLAGLRRLRERDFAVLAPGHGPPVTDVTARLDGYVAHRLERERRLVAALERGARCADALLDAAWGDVPEELRLFARLTLVAHLDKLEEEGRLPDGVERPEWVRSATPW